MRASRVAAASMVVVIGLAGVGTARLATAEPPGTDRGGAPGTLDRPRRGEDAVIHLGSQISEVARVNGKSVADVVRTLRADPTLWVDTTGRLFYVEPETATPAPGGAGTLAAPFPLDQTFLLHSRPGASRTIFLDVDGHTVTGTAWNTTATGSSFYAEPYTQDTDGTTFNDAEREQIQLMWARIAEDYAPFDIDVTTQDPGFDAINRSSSSDAVYGTRVLVTGADEYSSICTGGCGGVAYVGTFDTAGSSHAYYQPAWVFTQGVGTGAKNIAEAASHEAGHNLGLSHDGTASVGYYRGQGPWAPIMGVGYYEPVSQWSSGEYTGANNTEDDFVVMQANGAPLRADDAGDTVSAAVPLGSGPTVSVGGLIRSRTDVDVFGVVAGAGPATFTVTPAPTGPDLDARLDLLDASGAVVASSDPAVQQVDASAATGLGASISTTLAAGTYFLAVDGVGFGDPASTGYSDYASVGAYTLTGTFTTAGPPPTTTTPTTTTPTTTTPTTTTPTTTTVPLQPPAPPASVSVSGQRTVNLAWSASAGATSYEVQREQRLAGGTWTAPSTVVASTTATTATDRPGAGTFRYSVRAWNAAGASAWTVSATITTKR